eukprot:scaffold34983_cov229-Amphora_coffeaeformis.AAC.1
MSFPAWPWTRPIDMVMRGHKRSKRTWWVTSTSCGNGLCLSPTFSWWNLKGPFWYGWSCRQLVADDDSD